ncbi:MAG: single-stranded-DNA-specific exonuclease RecJ [Myxococcales bacterium]|nr:single-stranded-DNA-specific exonuclease RecJ [Myxococcales bacterium]
MQLRLRTVDDRLVGKLATALRVKPATARCLVARGVSEPQDAQSFIDPRLAALRPPAGLAGMTKAVTRIADAVQRGERIGIFGDYDVDGVTTAALLTSFLRASGAAVEPAVARRMAGYGFTKGAAEDLVARGCNLIVTGDCGTSDLEAIQAAGAAGVDVIVVDHHTVPSAEIAHPAYSLVNPYRADSTFPFRGMASVGLAFYVAASVRTELRDRGWYRLRLEPDVRDLLDLVALGTIADLVPLAAENRILTALGLRRLQSRVRPGVAALLASAGVDSEREVDARTVAWKLAPRINAPGRLGEAMPSLELLLADDQAAAGCAQVLEEANTERRSIQDKVMKEALAMMGDRDPGSAIVLAGEGWAPGVVGIIAAKLVDKFQRPAFVVGIDRETGIGRGSARTAGGINLYKALSAAAPFLDRYGGHAAAAGFTMRRESVAELTEALSTAVTRLAEGSGPTSTARDVDAEVQLDEVDERLAQELAGLGPFGQENPAPLLVTRHAKVTGVRRVGDGSHLKLTVEDSRAITRTAIGFGLGDRPVEVGAMVDLAFVPTVSTWQGRRSAELEVADLSILS